MLMPAARMLFNAGCSSSSVTATAAGERRPCVHPHCVVDRCAVHFGRAANGELNRSIFHFAREAEDRTERLGIDAALKTIYTLMICAGHVLASGPRG
jgi:hypothetical protein